MFGHFDLAASICPCMFGRFDLAALSWPVISCLFSDLLQGPIQGRRLVIKLYRSMHACLGLSDSTLASESSTTLLSLQYNTLFLTHMGEPMRDLGQWLWVLLSNVTFQIVYDSCLQSACKAKSFPYKTTSLQDKEVFRVEQAKDTELS
jgi:hypothetical protein